ncbi:hypothetical protein D9M71_716990 [compost metagenome]
MRGLTLHSIEQLAAVDADEKIVGADTEAPPQTAQIHHPGRVEQLRGLLHQVTYLLAQLQCLWRRYQTTASTHQDRIANSLADARQRATHGRRAEVHPPRRAHYAALVEKGVEGDQQVHVW